MIVPGSLHQACRLEPRLDYLDVAEPAEEDDQIDQNEAGQPDDVEVLQQSEFEEDRVEHRTHEEVKRHDERMILILKIVPTPFQALQHLYSSFLL